MSIQQALQNILNAVYGEEVRTSIHDAIYQISQIAGIKFGNGAPAVEDYEDGAVYIDEDDYKIYKLENGTWQLKGTIKGEDGEPGRDGEDAPAITGLREVSHVGLVRTYEFVLSNGETLPWSVSDGASGSGTGDMLESEFTGNNATKSVHKADNVGDADTEVLEKFGEDSDGNPTYNSQPIKGGHELVTTREELEAITRTGDKVVEAFLVKQISHEGGQEYSEIHVHTSEDEFKGLTVTAQELSDIDNGTLETVTGVIDNDGYCNLKIHNIGTYEVYVEQGGSRYNTVLNIPYFSIYVSELVKEFATITVTSEIPETFGQVVTLVNNGYTATGILSSSGSASIKVSRSGDYTISTTGTDGHIRTVTVEDVEVSRSGNNYNAPTFEIDYATIDVTTDEPELFSHLFTASKGTAEENGMFNDAGIGSIHVFETGLWNITASGASDTASAKVNVTAVNETFEVRLSYAWIVGMKVDESVDTSNARITLLEDAASWDFATMNATTHAYDLGGFENWKWLDEVYPAMVSSAGVEQYKLDPTDYTKKLSDGTASDVANTAYDGGAFCKIPKLYVYQKVEGNNRFVYFGETKQIIVDRLNLDSTEADKVEANGFIDELTGVAVENSHVWLPMFYGTNVGGKLKSIAAGVPLNTDGGTANEYTYISANGNRAAFMGGSIIETLTDIFYMMFGTTSSQQICAGYNTGGSGASSFKANAVIGKGQDGLFYGSQDNGSLNKIFHSIALGSYQLWQRDPYLIQSSGKIYVSPHYKYSLTAAGYVNTGITKGTNSAWTYIKKKLNLIPGWGAFSSDDGATDSTAYADGSYYIASGVRVCIRFGCYSSAGLDGLSAVNLGQEASYSAWDTGASVLLFPPVSP